MPEPPSPADAFVQSVDARFAPIVEALDRAVRTARPDLDAKVSYGMLMYTRDAEFRNWVCAIGVTTKLVCLRFLHGDQLSDPAALLRPGTSTLSTIDFAPGDPVDAEMLAGYVQQAAANWVSARPSRPR